MLRSPNVEQDDNSLQEWGNQELYPADHWEIPMHLQCYWGFDLSVLFLLLWFYFVELSGRTRRVRINPCKVPRYLHSVSWLLLITVWNYENDFVFLCMSVNCLTGCAFFCRLNWFLLPLLDPMSVEYKILMWALGFLPSFNGHAFASLIISWSWCVHFLVLYIERGSFGWQPMFVW